MVVEGVSRVMPSSPSLRMALLILLVSAGALLVASAAFAGAAVSAGADVGLGDGTDLQGLAPSDPAVAVPQADLPTAADVDAASISADGLVDEALALAAGATGTTTPQAVTGGHGGSIYSPRVSATQAGPAQYVAEGAKSGALALGGAGLIGALFWAKEALALGASRFLVAPLFSRIDKDEMLENDGRESLYNHITANPGVSLSELADRSGLGWGTTVYHLGRLEQAGFVTSLKNGQSRLFFSKDRGAVQNKRAIAVLKNQTAGDLARFLLATPGATQSTIGKSLGLGAPTVTKYVKRLEAEGLVSVTADGRSKIVAPTPTLGETMLHLDAPAPMVGIASREVEAVAA